MSNLVIRDSHFRESYRRSEALVLSQQVENYWRSQPATKLKEVVEWTDPPRTYTSDQEVLEHFINQTELRYSHELS